MIGTKLAHYEITSHLGSGGMGDVYQATDTKLGRGVAIKFLPEAFSHDTERVARFQREARVLASLNHPNIAAIHGVEEINTRHFLVMELVPGETLADRIKRGAVPIEEALPIAKQIAEALEEAHEKGIIHRDLKPANIKVTPDGKVKVLDFGLAKAYESEQANVALSNSPTFSMAATNAGVILGTAAYMSPEQASGKSVDKRTDLWAFGVVLLEMLTGRLVFEGETVSHVLAAVLTKDPDWSALPAKTPTTIRKLLRRCLEKDRKRRIESAADARLEIEEALTAPSSVEVTPAGAAPSPASRGAWRMIAVVAVLIALALGFIHFQEKPPDEPVLRYTVNMTASFIPSVAISPDGRYIAIAGSSGVRGDAALFIRPLDALQTQRLPGTEGAVYPFWSPDSRYIAFAAQGKLKKIAVAGGPAQTLCDLPRFSFSGGTWNRDDTILLSVTGPLLRVSAAGGTPVEIPNGRGAFPAFLPDGRHFLNTHYVTGQAEQGIWVSSLDGKETRRILADRSSAVFAPSDKRGRAGHVLFVREGNLMVLPFDPESRQATGDVFPVVEGVFVDGNGMAAIGASTNGILLYSGSGAARNNIVWSDRSGKVSPTGLAGDVWEPAISPDEKAIAYMRNNGSASDIWLRDLVHSLDQRFTSDPSANNTPVWSPKGDRIVFRSTRGGGLQQQLYQQSASGAGPAEALTKSPSFKFASQWSKDGRFLVITNNAGGNLDLLVLPMTEGSSSGVQDPQKFLVTQFVEAQGQISPDGHWMAYSSDDTGQLEVYVRPFPVAEGVWRISTAGGQQPRWRGDGKELFFIGGDGKMMAADIKAMPGPKPVFDHGEAKPLFDAHIALATGTFAFQYDVTPDGKRFLVDTGGATDSTFTVVVNWQAGIKK
jgi:serine/threonine protein kinase/Tol biopolymer transport system component